MARLIGTNASETINGTADDDVIRGKKGDDLIFGNDGADNIRGGGGADTIDGGDGWDIINGGGGKDVIYDGGGYDQMKGGGGADLFVMAADGYGDYIQDWETKDTIDLSALGVTSFDQLNIVYNQGFATIYTQNDGSLILSGRNGADITAADLTADKFIFAQPQPTVMDFEDLDAPYNYADFLNAVDPEYGDFTWSNNVFFFEKDEVVANQIDIGANNSTADGNVAISNIGGLDINFCSEFNFNFQEMTIGSLFHDGMTVAVTGYDDGVATGTQYITVDTLDADVVQMDQNIFGSVDEVAFTSYGGTYSPDIAPNGAADPTNFYIEEFVFG